MVHQAQCIPFPGGIKKKGGEVNTGVGINIFKDAVSIDSVTLKYLFKRTDF